MDSDSDYSDEWNDGGESSDDEEWTARSPTYRRRPVERKPTSSGGSKATSRKGAFKRNAVAALLTLSALATAGGVLPISRPCNEPFKLPSGETVLLATPKAQLDEWWAESQSLVQEMNVLVDGFNKTRPKRGGAEPAARRDSRRPIRCEAVDCDELRRVVPALRRPHDERRERVGGPGAARFLAHVCRFGHHHAGVRRGDCGRPQGHGRVLPGPEDGRVPVF